ncbi:MAG: SIMPL domain-containing protein, partial [Oscillospiraceae bacterium]|nr:SIMPL domain-containing protein [Oscillospiraceae bacterium]
DKVDAEGVWKNRFTGYRATESLKLELGLDNKLLGELLTAVSAASAHPEINVRFSVKDKTKLKDRLISRAVKDSARKAKILCEAADVELGEVMTINYSFREPEIISPTAYNRGVGLMEAKAAMCDITPEDVSLTDSVTVLWEIK